MTYDTDGTPLNVGRRTRAISPATRRTLYKRDDGCQFSGCMHTLRAESHHVTRWADGGGTSLPGLVTLRGFQQRRIPECGHTPTHSLE
jgi:hypothetical protein